MLVKKIYHTIELFLSLGTVNKALERVNLLLQRILLSDSKLGYGLRKFNLISQRFFIDSQED